MQCESTRGTAGAMGGRSSDEPLTAAIEDAVAAAIEGGATMDEIVARVRPRDDDCSPLIPRARRCARARPDEGRWAERMDSLICLQRETDRFAEEWERTRDPRAEGLSALIAIETLRTLALRTMAELGAHEEPVPTEGLGRLALALYRIESADKLRIEREQAAADAAAAHAGPAARAAGMTHAERVETVRRALEGHVFPGRTDPPPPASGWAAASPADSPSPRRTPRPSRLPTAGRRMRTRPGRASRVHARKQTIHGTGTGAGCQAETAGGGRPTLADRPSLLPRGMERARVRRGFRIRRSRTRDRLLIPRPRPFRPARPGPWCGARRARRACALQCTNERAHGRKDERS